MSKNEILVVGAGPVGLTMAAELARHGVACRIIDKGDSHAADSRAVAIHARTMEVFEDMGIVDYPLKHGLKVNGINLYSHGKKLIHAKIQNLNSKYNYILDMPQSFTEPMLIDHLKQFGVEVERGIELTEIMNQDDCVFVKLNGNAETFAYVIGCDGAGSSCRHLLNIPFPGEEYPSSWAVFDTILKWPHPSKEVYIFFDEDGICGLFPLPGDRMRVTCELPKQMEASYETLEKILRKRISMDLEFIDSKDLSSFILHHRQVSSYRKERVFLAGDAAHVHSPAGGQGMNTGIQDAYNLAWKLALVHKGLAEDALLDSYHDERYPIGKWVLKMTDKITRVVTTRNSALSLIRNALFSIINHIGALKSQMPKSFSQLYLKYPESPIIQTKCKIRPKHVHAGERAPDHPVISMATGDEARLFELFKGTHFTLLLFSGTNPSQVERKALEDLYNTVCSHDLIRPYLIMHNEEMQGICKNIDVCFIDKKPSVHAHYGIEKATAILVRPDGYIGLINQPVSSSGLGLPLSFH